MTTNADSHNLRSAAQLIKQCITEDGAACMTKPQFFPGRIRAINEAASEALAILNAIIGPTLTMDEYLARSRPRLSAIDRLSEKIDFSSQGWSNTPEGERWVTLMREQAKDEQAAGL